MKTLFIVGKPFPESTKHLIKLGYQLGLFLDKNIDVKPEYLANLSYIIPVDFSNTTTIKESLNEFKQDVQGLICTYENYVLPKAILGELLNIPTLSIEAASVATNKFLMRQKFQAFDTAITPKFQQVNSKEDLLAFAESSGFPLMLKPTDLVKSLMIFRCDNTQELLQNYQYLLAELPQVYNKYNVNKEPSIIVEEFMQGTMHTVAAFMDASGNVYLAPDIVDNTTANEIGFKDNYIFSRSIPSTLSKDQQDALKNVATLGMKALDLRQSPGHVELFYTPSGPKIIEIGARIGGYRSRMYNLARGTDLLAAEAAIATGETPLLGRTEDKYCKVIEIFPAEIGKLKLITNEDKLKDLASLYSYKPHADNGDLVGLASQGYKAVANIILLSDNQEIIEADYLFIKNNIKIELQ